jgi:hypothetical protein
VKDLENEKADIIQKKGVSGGAVGGVVSKNMRSTIGGGMGHSPTKNSSIDDPKANEDLINFLEHKLEEIEKKLSSTQSEYEVLQNDYMEL